jgi:hypothetical protein
MSSVGEFGVLITANTKSFNLIGIPATLGEPMDITVLNENRKLVANQESDGKTVTYFYVIHQ